MTELQQLKRKFRSSKEWKEFRDEIKQLQNNTDPITGSKLSKTANLHHRFVTANIDEYTDISNKDDFVLLSHSCHKFLHWLHKYWKKDPFILNKIEGELIKWH